MRIQLKELYATDISESLISRVTDNVMEEVKIWQNRALDGYIK
jgi:transposase-like protein